MVSASNFKSVDDGKFTLTANAFLPSHALIPLYEDDNDSVDVVVQAGDTVKEGQIIAKTAGMNIHASIPGKIAAIERHQYSNGKQGLCADITLKGALSYTGKKQTSVSHKMLEGSSIAFMLKEAGVINTFKNNAPVYKDIKKIKDRKDSVLVLRLFNNDPSCLTEEFISEKYTEQVITGAAVLAKAASVKAVVIAENKNHLLQLDEFIKTHLSDMKTVKIQVETKKYPCGTMHDLVTLTKKTVQDEEFKDLGKNDFFIDSITALHAYNAVILGKPVINSIIHVTGDCLNSAAIMNIKLGTSLKTLAEQCGGFKRKLSKIVINGIISGKTVSNLDVPVSKSIKSIEFVPVKQVKVQYAESCIRCGNCRKICPVNLFPGNLYRVMHQSEKQNSSINAQFIKESAILCTECGLCNTVCPARLSLVQTISLLKDKNDEK